MQQTLLMNVTLATASVLGLLYIVLMLRIVRMRFQNRISLGDGGNAEILKRIRAHGNFAEYVPLLLILMGLLEMAGTDKTWLSLAGVVLVLCRMSHVVGIHRPAPNFFRALGVVGTTLLIMSFCLYGLWIVFAA